MLRSAPAAWRILVRATMAYCLIGLGSNLGERASLLDEAVRRLRHTPELQVVAQSRWRETTPLGGPAGQPSYLNGAVLVETPCSPHTLLTVLQAVEDHLGRRREQRWGPRTVDLDLLLYDEEIVESAALCVPHPRMAWRRFVLEPAVEIAPQMRHPTIGWTLARLLTHLNQATNHVAIAAAAAAPAHALAERLSAALPARLLTASVVFPLAEGEKRTGTPDAIPLEFLRQSAALLAANGPAWSPPGQSGQATVSDFWFDQWRAWAEAMLPATARQAFLGEWERLAPTVMPPKLLVVLASRDRQELFQQALREASRRPDQGPVLVVDDDDDPQRTWAEVLAAAQGIVG